MIYNQARCQTVSCVSSTSHKTGYCGKCRSYKCNKCSVLWECGKVLPVKMRFCAKCKAIMKKSKKNNYGMMYQEAV